MKKTQIIRRPTRVTDIDGYADDMYNDYDTDRAERVRVRRWRAVKHQAV